MTAAVALQRTAAVPNPPPISDRGDCQTPGLTLVVAVENRYRRAPDGRVCSTTGVDGYRFWERYLAAFARVLVLARTGDSPEPAAGEPVEGPRVEVVPLPDYHGALGFVRARRRLNRAAGAAVERADVLCLRAPGPIAGLVWRLRGGRPFGVEVIGDPLDAFAPGAVRDAGRSLARLILARELRAMCHGAVATSYVTEEALQRRYPAGGWSTAYSSIDLGDEAFRREEDAAEGHRERRGTSDDPWRLVSVGTLAQLYKGHDVLIDAVAACRARGRGVTLTIVGDGQCRGWLEERARRRGVADLVRFAGQLPAGAAIRAELDRADLFVLASRQEGLPRAMIEAMARGLPCVGTRVGGVPELLPPERLVPPGDARALGETIRAVCTEPGARREAARRDLVVARRYHRDVLRPRRVAFYERLRAAAVPARAPTATAVRSCR